jgi:hypothetical protein
LSVGSISVDDHPLTLLHCRYLQVVAKVMLDMETDDDGVLPPSAAAIYRPGMKHEHRVYKELKAACSGTPLGIPATYCSSAVASICMCVAIKLWVGG